MELIFIWLQEYNGIYKEEGFNFSGQFRFGYDPQSGLLNYTVNEQYVPDFFRLPGQSAATHSHVRSITAVVGENGAGKTSILEYIKHELVYGRKVKRSVALNVFRDDKGKFHACYHERLKVVPADPKQIELTAYNNDIDAKRLYSPGFKALENTSCVFFSPVADNRRSEADKLRLLNISTNYLLQKETRGGFLNHRYKEIFRQIQFLNEGKPFLRDLPEELRRSLPKHLEITLNQQNDLEEELSEPVAQFLQAITERLQGPEGEHPFLYPLRVAIVKNAVREIVEDFPEFLPAEDLELFPNALEQSGGRELFEAFLQVCSSLGMRVDSEFVMRGMFMTITMTRKIDLYRLIDSALQEGQFTYKRKSQKLVLEFDEQELVEVLLDLYPQAIKSGDLFNFDWKDLSSGQKALLGMCARFFSIAPRHGRNTRLKSNLIFLIDEGEVYLHPQWQKELLHLLLTLLPKMFHSALKTYTLQIVLTSNSPFLISDLPSSNVIFLKQGANGRTNVIDGLEEHRQTFASNIHSLFAHSFFMQDGLMGKLAKRKINAVIDMLVNGTRQQFLDRKREIRNIIELVGEPLIRNKLLQMFEEKISLDYLELDGRIAALESELGKLKRKRRGKGRS